MPGEFFGGMGLGGVLGALLRQPEVEAARSTAWTWYHHGQALEQRVRSLTLQLVGKEFELLSKDEALKDKDAQIAELTKPQAMPQLPPPGSNTHHQNGHELN